MKMIITKDCTYLSHTFKKGQKVDADRQLAKHLVRYGKGAEHNFVSLQDEIVEEVQTEEGEPTAKDLVAAMPTISTPEILDKYANDSRKTVRDAAEKRITELSLPE